MKDQLDFQLRNMIQVKLLVTSFDSNLRRPELKLEQGRLVLLLLELLPHVAEFVFFLSCNDDFGTKSEIL